MTSQQGQLSLNVNIGQILLAFIAAMIVAGAFVAYITNTIVDSKVSAMTNVQNPTTTAAAPQSNIAGGFCTDPSTPPVADTSSPANLPSVANNPNMLRAAYGPVNLSYNQSNTSSTTNTSTNTNVDSRYSGNTNSQSWNNGNTLTDNRNSGNTTVTDSGNTTTIVANNGNTTNTNSGNTVVTDNSSTTTVTDNSVNTNVSDNNVIIAP